MSSNTTPTPSLDEAEVVASHGAKGKRITLTQIKNEIREVRYMVPGLLYKMPTLDHPLLRLTVCYIVLRNGFVLVGKSAAMDPDNFDPEKGKTFAYEDALRQAWPLMAFAELERQRAP